ncbi:MAG: FixH family protein [Candidatus Competibacteraceae bacterium]|jgi:nitrogen fixation protein FixH|nr:FixH family protein [Candidatus Competibacteraceae bacterium]
MVDMLASLATGVVLIVAANAGLFYWGGWSALRSALVVALIAVTVYLSLVIGRWPGGDIVAIHLALYLLASYGCGLFLGLRGQSGTQSDARTRWHWGPALLIGFFVTLAAVNAVFIVLAQRGLSPQLSQHLLPARESPVTSFFPGEISHDFQEKEALFNDYLAQRRRQEERGWRVQRGWLQRPVLGQPATFKIVVRTRNGEPVTDAEIHGRFLRPANSAQDTTFAMHETEAGVYLVDLQLPAAGRWDLVLHVDKADERHEIRATTTIAAP